MRRLSRAAQRKRRHLRAKRKVLGTKERPRVSVFRSNANFYLTLVDDSGGNVLCALSTLSKEFKEKNLSHSNTVEAARVLAGLFVEKIEKNGVTSVVFDRSGYRYHGKVKVVAESLREQGLLA